MIVKLDPDKVRELFETGKDQADVLLALYEMVIPDWKAVERLGGFPTCSYETSVAIAQLFIDFDREHHPRVLPGGLWMNSGFSNLSGEHLKPWEVDASTAKPVYREAP